MPQDDASQEHHAGKEDITPLVSNAPSIASKVEPCDEAAISQEHVTSHVTPEPPYHILKKSQKWPLVLLVAFAGIFSPMSANIFFSAILAVAQSLGTSVEKVNLSVTAYMSTLFFPEVITARSLDYVESFPGNHTKLLRPVLLATFCVYIGASAGLAVTNSYGLLVALRFIQAAGSASVNSVGGGLIGDIAERSERGGFMGVYQLGPQLGPALGPLIGGLLTQAYGWRSIFAFLACAASIPLLLMIFFLPETLRSLVGNGSVRPKPLNMSVLVWYKSRHSKQDAAISDLQASNLPRNKTWKDVNWLASLQVFREPDALMVLCFNAVCYTLFYTVITSNGNVLQQPYGLEEAEIGLTYLAFGAGCICAAVMNTKRLDWDYRRTVKKAIKKGLLPDHLAKLYEDGKGSKISLDDVEAFPIEYARLGTLPFYFGGLVAAVIGYGWTVQYRVHLSVPLIFQFIVGLTSTTTTNSNTTLLVDLFPERSASAVAAINLSRCLLGAGGTAVIDPLLRALGAGWTYTLVALVSTLALPLCLVEIKFGSRLRCRRKSRTL